MTGARLETQDRLRNVYPYVAHTNIRASIALAAMATKETAITLASKLPFDAGPDKSARVYFTLTGIYLQVSANSYVTPPRLSGLIYYRTPEGRQIILTAIDSTFGAAFTESNPNAHITPSTSFNADSINTMGWFGYEDIAGSLGSATTVTINVYANIGMYGDYSEPDWLALFQRQQHEHTGLPVGASHNDNL